MRATLAACLCAALFTVPAVVRANTADGDPIRQISQALNAQPEHRFLMSLVGAAAHFAVPPGSRDIHLAVLRAPVGPDPDGRLDARVTPALGPGWSLIVRSRLV